MTLLQFLGVLFGAGLATALVRRLTVSTYTFPPVYQGFAPQFAPVAEPEIPDRAARKPGFEQPEGEPEIHIPPDAAIAPPPSFGRGKGSGAS